MKRLLLTLITIISLTMNTTASEKQDAALDFNTTKTLSVAHVNYNDAPIDTVLATLTLRGEKIVAVLVTNGARIDTPKAHELTDGVARDVDRAIANKTLAVNGQNFKNLFSLIGVKEKNLNKTLGLLLQF